MTQGTPGDAAEPVADWAGQAVPGTGRTMELLLELQKQAPVAAAAAESKAAAKAATLRVAAPANPSANPPANPPAEGLTLGPAVPSPAAVASQAPVLFGVAAEPAIRSSAQHGDASWQSSPRSSTQAQRPQQHTGELQRWVLLPAELIAWLRQNRNTVVVAAVVVLVLVGLGSAVASRGRYAR